MLLVLPFLAFGGEPLTFCGSFGGADNDIQAYSWILYGQRSGKIAFVIFQTSHGTNTDYSKHVHLTLHSTNTVAGSGNVGEGWIDMPDGTKRDLPTSNMVFEYTDGVFHSAPIEMSEDDFLHYIFSRQEHGWGPFQGITVDELKKFEKTLKTKSSNNALQPTATAPPVSTNK